MPPADRAHAGNEPEPVQKKNEDEDGGEKPKRLLHQLAADHALEKIVKTLHHPFPKILQPGRDRLDLARRQLREKMMPAATIHVTTIEFVTVNLPMWKSTVGLSGSV